MREILFRVKRVDNGEWVICGTIDQMTYTTKIGCDEVIPESVGQFTGITKFS